MTGCAEAVGLTGPPHNDFPLDQQEPPRNGAELSLVPVLPEIRPWVWNGAEEIGWPGLTPYQKTGISFAVGRRNASLWWGCGAGKTVAAIMWALAEDGPVTVVCRASARRQWASEVRRFSTIEPFVVKPVGDRRAGDETLASYLARVRRPFLILGWNALQDNVTYAALSGSSVYQKAGKKIRSTTTVKHPELIGLSIVWDEAHCAKDHKRWSPQAQPDGKMRFTPRNTVAARAGFLAPKCKRRLALTATPIPDRIRDLWAQLDIVEPGCCGKYWDWAQKHTGAREDVFGWDDKGATNLAELGAFLKYRTHVVRSDEVNQFLPPMRRVTTYLSPEDMNRASAEANKAVKVAAKLAGGGTGLEDRHGSEGFVRARLNRSASMKRKHLRTALPEYLGAGQKIVVFTGLRVDVWRIEKDIRKIMGKLWPPDSTGTGADWKVCAADGSIAPDKREDIRDEYMAHRGPGLLVATGDSFGESQNLQDTDRLINVVIPWNWRGIRQREGRADRLGRTRSLVIEYLINDALDARVLAIVLAKLGVTEELLPDPQVIGVREAVQGGSDDELLDRMLDRMFAD